MRIVIVEDEPRIREGLAKLIRKIDPGYEVVGEAADGLSGLGLIEERRPDLVITDVRMPDLDGLGMLRRLGEGSAGAKAIVLSAYSEFSYARQAIELGVSEYLLKPISVGDLTRSLKKIEARIAAERRPGPPGDGLSLEGALYSIALGGAAVDAELRSSLEGSVDVEGGFALAAIYLGSGFEGERRRIAGLARATLAKATGFEYRILEAPRGGKLLVVAYNVAEPESTRAWFEGRFAPRMREAGLRDLRVGWGAFRGLGGLRDGARRIDACLDWSISLGGEAMLAWPEVESTPVVPLCYPVALEGAVRSALCSMDRGKFESGLREFLGFLRSDGPYSPRDIKNSLIRFYWSALGTAREVEYERYEALARREMLERITFAVTWPELEEAALTLLELLPGEAPPSRAEEPSSGGGSVVRRARNVVREFYSQGISLSEVALKIGVSSEYLSAQFHRETGMTFSAYIRDFRVRKAKELLLGTGLKLYAVGERVGYRDSKYFCRVFKEATGQSPSEYRRANR
jgi:two-component system, response regulator YesN